MRTLAVAVVIGLLATGPAAAQAPAGDPTSAIGDVLGGKLGNQMGDLLRGQKKTTKAKKKKRGKKRKPVASVVTVAASGRQTDFVPPQDRVMVNSMVNLAEGTDQEKEALRAALNAGLDSFDAGPGKNNVAASITFMLVACMDVAQGVEVGPEQFKLAASTLDAALAVDPQFKAMQPNEKQVLYETGVVLGTAILFARSEAERQKDPTLAEQARAGAAQILAGFNIQSPQQPTP